MRIRKWLTGLLLVCLALCPAALAEGAVSENVDAAVPEEAGFELYGIESNAAEVLVGDAMPVAEDAPVVNAVQFADDKFGAWAASHCDANGDGLISDDEAKTVSSIDISGLGISSLSGLERFTAVVALDCSNNRLTALELSGNPALTSLNCAGNAIAKLDLTPCAGLAATVSGARPTLQGEALTWTGVSIPATTAIWLDDALFYDVNAAAPILPKSTALGVKGKYDIMSPEGGCPARYCSFSTSNKKIATVSAEGIVSALKTGSVKITATAFDGRTATCDVTVAKAPSKVTLPVKALEIGVGEKTELVPTLPAKTATSFNWTSSNPYVASVKNGVIEGLSTGSATVTVTTANGKKASCTVTVVGLPDAIELSPSPLTLMTPQTATLRVICPEGTACGVTWSHTGDCISVDPKTGLITAFSEGTATVTATATNGVSATCDVTVTPGPDSIVLNDESVSLCVGQSYKISAKTLRDGAETGHALDFATSNPKIVTVTSDGVITGVKKGTAKVTLSTPNGLSAVCAVSVVKAPSSVKLSPANLTLAVGTSKKLTATPSVVTWSGYDPAVISVEDDGTVTGLSAGRTSVTATTYNGKKATCSVTVRAEGETPEHRLIAVAHRGGRAYWPENTLEAFSHSASTGADMIEMDVQTTSDGVQVIHHDASFKANGKTWKIPKNSYSKLKEQKPSLCTLDEALELIYTTGLDLQLELKDSANAKKCVEAVKEYKMEDRTWYISFNTKQLKSVRSLDGSARLGYIFSGKVPKDLYKTIDSLNLSALMVKQDILTQARLDEYHDLGLLVNVWTVNTKEECRKYADMGVDFITSDYPDYAAAVK